MDPYNEMSGPTEPLTDAAHKWWMWFLYLCLAPIALALAFYIVLAGLDRF